MRKTVTVDSLRRQHEAIMALRLGPSTPTETIDGMLQAANWMLERALHDTGQYKGFGYINLAGTLITPTHPDYHEYRRRYY